ncbi:MAG: hypothetical protein Q8P70_00820 [bacterium]|nr:hypothetical protein [bacterium]
MTTNDLEPLPAPAPEVIVPESTNEDPPSYPIGPMPSAQKPNGEGTIKGSHSFPGEMIPIMGTCARLVDGVDIYCTEPVYEKGFAPYGVGYRLKVPEGTYYVFSEILYREQEQDSQYQACYSGYTPGIGDDSVPPSSHEPIPVHVRAGEVVQNISPVDFLCTRIFPRPDEETLKELLEKFFERYLRPKDRRIFYTAVSF